MADFPIRFKVIGLGYLLILAHFMDKFSASNLDITKCGTTHTSIVDECTFCITFQLSNTEGPTESTLIQQGMSDNNIQA